MYVSGLIHMQRMLWELQTHYFAPTYVKVKVKGKVIPVLDVEALRVARG
jgi:hypothetical protein